MSDTPNVKYRFELSNIGTRTHIRNRHPAVALVLEAFGKDLVDKLNAEACASGLVSSTAPNESNGPKND